MSSPTQRRVFYAALFIGCLIIIGIIYWTWENDSNTFDILAKYNLEYADCKGKDDCSGLTPIIPDDSPKLIMVKINEKAKLLESFATKSKINQFQIIESEILKFNVNDQPEIRNQLKEILPHIHGPESVISLCRSVLDSIVDLYQSNSRQSKEDTELNQYKVIGMDGLIAVNKSVFISAILTAHATLMEHRVRKIIAPVYINDYEFNRQMMIVLDFVDRVKAYFKKILSVSFDKPEYQKADSLIRYNGNDSMDSMKNTVLNCNKDVQPLYRSLLSVFDGLSLSFEVLQNKGIKL